MIMFPPAPDPSVVARRNTDYHQARADRLAIIIGDAAHQMRKRQVACAWAQEIRAMLHQSV